MTTTLHESGAGRCSGPEPMLAGEKSRGQLALVKLFALVPLLALATAVPFAWAGSTSGSPRSSTRSPAWV